MKNNKKWFSLVLAIWVTLVMTLLAFTILEYMIPFSKNVKGIENSSKAFYQANIWIEEALYDMKWKDAWYESLLTISWDSLANGFDIKWEWKRLPPTWLWNSDYNKDWNKISRWNPIQLEVWWNKIPSNLWSSYVKFYFQIPDLDWDGINSDLTLSWSSNFPIINWQLSAENNTLNSSWSYIIKNEIDWIERSLYHRWWVDLFWTTSTFQDFYWNVLTWNCDDTEEWCILKLSVINKLETTDGTILPYLEWKIALSWPSDDIPLRYARIKGEWKSSWFRKELNVKVSQQTVIEAFDFTVLQ